MDKQSFSTNIQSISTNMQSISTNKKFKEHEFDLAIHHHNLKKSLLKKLTLTWLLVIVIASISVGMLIQFGIQHSTNVVQSLLEKKAEEQQISEKPIELTTYRSDEYGYEIKFNPEVFKVDRATDLSKPNLSEIGLTTQETATSRGLGYILLSAYNSTDLISIEKDQAITGNTLLEKAANWYQNKKFKDLTDTSTFVKKELIKRWDKDVYQLTYKRRVLNTDVFHYIYVVLQNDKLYTILADYPKSGVSQELVESWIDEIAFLNPQTPQVQAATTQKSPELNEVKLVELSKPSVVQIVSVNCVLLKVKDSSRVKVLKPQYDLCTGGSGSGFMIGKDGLVGTNGHVVKASFEDLIYSGRPEPGSGGDFYSDLTKELVAQASAEASSSGDLTSRPSVSKFPSSLDAVMKKIEEFKANGILDEPVFKDSYFVKLANDPIKFPKLTPQTRSSFSYRNLQPVDREKTIFNAELVSYDFGGLTQLSTIAQAAALSGNAPKREKSSDVALIKLNGLGVNQYPGVPLLESAKVKEGQSLLVMGYPGLVSGQDAKSAILLDETASSVRPTITRGIISAIKQDTFGQILLQTDASIEHGNSGGPAFNYNGEVIGIATYVMTSGSGNYNFLRAIEDLHLLMEKENINKDEMSESYTLWKDGLNHFWEGRLTKAKENFEKVKELYPVHALVDEYIDSSTKGIEAGEDVELQQQQQSENKAFNNQTVIYAIIAALLGALGLVGGALTMFFLRDHAKKKNLTPQQLQQLMGPPSAPPATPAA